MVRVAVVPMRNLVVSWMRPESAYLVVKSAEHAVSQAIQYLNARLTMRCALGIARRGVCQSFQRGVKNLDVSVSRSLSVPLMICSVDGFVTRG